MTVEQIVRDYLAYKTGQMLCGLLSKAACIKTHYYLESFARDFGQQEVEACRRSDLKRFLGLHPEYRSPHTHHAACSQIVTCFRWAEEDGLIPKCPYRKPRDLPTPQPRDHIEPEQVRAILRAAKLDGRGYSPIRFRLALWFMWETGCRTCELFRLDWSHYDPERGLFELASKTTAKTGKNRLIVLNRRAWRVVRFIAASAAKLIPANTVNALCTKVPAHPTAEGAKPVFLNGHGRRWTRRAFAKAFRTHAERAGIPSNITAYCLRHGFVVQALENGIGERQLADYIGHTGTHLISWYGRGTRGKIDYLRAVAEKKNRT